MNNLLVCYDAAATIDDSLDLVGVLVATDKTVRNELTVGTGSTCQIAVDIDPGVLRYDNRKYGTVHTGLILSVAWQRGCRWRGGQRGQFQARSRTGIRKDRGGLFGCRSRSWRQ